MLRLLKNLVPIALLAAGALGMGGMVATAPKPQKVKPEALAPVVRTFMIRKRDIRLSATSQGTVEPRTHGVVVGEVAGRVVEVSPSLAVGGFFEADEVLLRIDPRDYELALVAAKAQVARAHAHHIREQAEAEVAHQEWSTLRRGEPSALALREPQLAQAQADLEAARAKLRSAELNLERTVLRAPYACLVRQKRTDVGQYLTPGTPVAELYAIDFAEVRLPLSDEQVASLALPHRFGAEADHTADPKVVLRARFAGEEHLWYGQIVRTEGHFDARSRMLNAIARVSDPYGRLSALERPPLAVGMFVEAEIEGRLAADVAAVPRGALREGNQLVVVDDENRLRLQHVRVVRADAEEVFVAEGPEEGSRICLSRLDVITDGMKVRTIDDESTAHAPGYALTHSGDEVVR